MSDVSDNDLRLACSISFLHPPHDGCDGTSQVNRLRRELSALKVRLADFQKDAKRYRKVRSNPAMLLHLKNSEFDAAIDAAMNMKEPK